MDKRVTMETTTGSDFLVGLKLVLTDQNMFALDYTATTNYPAAPWSISRWCSAPTFWPRFCARCLMIRANKKNRKKSALLRRLVIEFAKKFTARFFDIKFFTLWALTGSRDVFVQVGRLCYL